MGKLFNVYIHTVGVILCKSSFYTYVIAFKATSQLKSPFHVVVLNIMYKHIFILMINSIACLEVNYGIHYCYCSTESNSHYCSLIVPVIVSLSPNLYITFHINDSLLP